MKVIVRKNDIDHLENKKDAIIVYMKNKKAWVCEKTQKLPEINQEFVTLELKGKSGK